MSERRIEVYADETDPGEAEDFLYTIGETADAPAVFNRLAAWVHDLQRHGYRKVRIKIEVEVSDARTDG